MPDGLTRVLTAGAGDRMLALGRPIVRQMKSVGRKVILQPQTHANNVVTSLDARPVRCQKRVLTGAAKPQSAVDRSA